MNLIILVWKKILMTTLTASHQVQKVILKSNDEEDVKWAVKELQNEDIIMATIEYIIANVGVSINLII